MNRRLSTAERGQMAETEVARHLEQLGYEICDRNYRVHRIGELDLIARQAGQLFIVEVKARSGSDEQGGLPLAITHSKLSRLRRTAWCYLKEKGMMNCDVSFLAALVHIDHTGNIDDLSVLPIEWL